ncbi:hypothetical protein [Spiroplasma endosymbiont of Nebria brevicollis]|uniref:hypothetical protein n=1 Tax=Spiroplasma endosymbiont of Nebria brevicollis TaxID=3066284 RepID=UPI00313EA614
MDEKILDILGLQLVDYFITQQGYLPFNVPKELKPYIKGEVYLTNKESNTYHIIKIIKENNFNAQHLKIKDDVYEVLHKQLEKDGIKEIRFLMIILNDDNENENRASPAVDVIIATPDKIVDEIAKFYPSIVKSVKVDLTEISNNENDSNNDEDSDDSKDTDGNGSNLSEKWKKVNFQNRRYLSDTLKKCSNANLVVTWFLFIIPIITYFAFLIIIYQTKDGWLSNNFNLQELIFGANYHNLIFGAHEYWRWLIYPFVGNDNGSVPINLIFSLLMFYRVGRFVEGFYGWWKAIIIWFGAMIVTGILQSVVDQYNIMSGFWVFVWISLGAMLPFIWNYKLFKTPIMSRFAITVVLMLFFWFWFDQQVVTLLYWMMAFALGWLFASIVGYHNRKMTVFYAFSPVALGAVFLLVALLYLLNNYYAVDYNNYTLTVLEQYKSYGLISQSTINSFMNNFFHYNW